MNKRIAEALVECNHALSYEIDKREHLQHNPPIALIRYTADTDYIRVECNPFADTLESRRQLDALEDWLYDKHGDLVGQLFADGEIYKTANRTHSEWRRFNIKWCFEQLAEKDDE